MAAIESSLLDLLSGEEQDRNAGDNVPMILQNSPYYDNDVFTNILCTKQNIFSLVSLNCQSLNAKYDEIKIFIENLRESSCKLSAFCLQETWLSDDSDASLFQLDDYNFISKGKSCSAHGGVAVYLHDSYDFKILPYYSYENIWDGIFIEVITKSHFQTANSKKLIIGNIYRPPRNFVDNYRVFVAELNNILSILQRSRNEVTVVGDFNLDLLQVSTNEHIKNYLDCMLSNGFIPKITFPTRLSHNHGTLIDNIFVKISNDYSETTAGILWHNISDHQPCFITLDFMTFQHTGGKYINVFSNSVHAKAKFQDEVRIACSLANFDASPSCNPNSNYDKFNNVITSALERNLPVKRVKYNKHKHKKSCWITRGIIQSIKFRDRLYADLQMTDINDASYQGKKVNLKTYNRILKQNIRIAKKNYYHSSFITFKDDIKMTWTTINGILNRTKKKKDFPKKFLIAGRYVSNVEDIANEFNNFFINIGRSLNNDIILPQDRSFEEYLTTPTQGVFEFKPVNKEIVLKVIESLKAKTSCGVDGLSNKLLKLIKHEIIDILTVIINQSLHTGIFPDKLKLAKVIPLYKKQENFLLGNYRPVSVLPSTSKVFERIMHSQIIEYFNEYNLLYPSQYGFRSNHSTELAALEVVDKIMTKMDDNEVPLNIYLDLSKAFDCLDHRILLTKLRFYGFHGKSLQLMTNYLDNRKQIVRLDATDSDYQLITTGVPQGSILGPLLFLIYINDVSNATSCFQPVIYADDTTLGACLSHFGNTLNLVERNINGELNKISTWLKVNKLSLNISKTKAMVFHPPQKRVTFPNLNIDGNRIEFVDYFNYLGIIFDKHMTWNKHIDHISGKISKICGVLNKLKNFLPQATMLIIYNSLVTPHLNYGSLLWGCKAGRLEGLQKKLVRVITCSKYNEHTEPLFKKLSLLKVTHICALHELKFCYRLEHSSLPYYFSRNVFHKFSSIHKYNTRGIQTFQLPIIKHSFMTSSLRYKIAKTFNETPKIITEKIYTHSMYGFKLYIKNYYINLYNSFCVIPDCYVCN